MLPGLESSRTAGKPVGHRVTPEAQTKPTSLRQTRCSKSRYTHFDNDVEFAREAILRIRAVTSAVTSGSQALLIAVSQTGPPTGGPAFPAITTYTVLPRSYPEESRDVDVLLAVRDLACDRRLRADHLFSRDGRCTALLVFRSV